MDEINRDSQLSLIFNNKYYNYKYIYDIFKINILKKWCQ